MTNNDIYKLVNFIVRKEGRGSPDILKNFTYVLQQANSDKFKFEYQKYQYNQNINDILSPFEVAVNVGGITTTATTITVPDDYAHFVGMYWTDNSGHDRAFDLVTDSQWDSRWGSTLTLPTDKYPICRIRGNYIDVNPSMETTGLPSYYGVGAIGLSVAEIQQLTMVNVAKGDKAYNFSPTSQVFYYAYPASYGDLTSILDDNGFETISDWVKTTRSFTSNPPYYTYSTTDYNVYEFDHITTQVDFTNTFKF